MRKVQLFQLNIKFFFLKLHWVFHKIHVIVVISPKTQDPYCCGHLSWNTTIHIIVVVCPEIQDPYCYCHQSSDNRSILLWSSVLKQKIQKIILLLSSVLKYKILIVVVISPQTTDQYCCGHQSWNKRSMSLLWSVLKHKIYINEVIRPETQDPYRCCHQSLDNRSMLLWSSALKQKIHIIVVISPESQDPYRCCYQSWNTRSVLLWSSALKHKNQIIVSCNTRFILLLSSVLKYKVHMTACPQRQHLYQIGSKKNYIWVKIETQDPYQPCDTWLIFSPQKFVPAERMEGGQPKNLGSIMERYWLSSNGISLIVDDNRYLTFLRTQTILENKLIFVWVHYAANMQSSGVFLCSWTPLYEALACLLVNSARAYRKTFMGNYAPLGLLILRQDFSDYGLDWYHLKIYRSLSILFLWLNLTKGGKPFTFERDDSWCKVQLNDSDGEFML